MSLRAWSNSSLMALYLSFCAYNSSSRSSIVFSSFATDLSANSARVSASFSLSVRILISSSYLSSFCEYFSAWASRDFRLLVTFFNSSSSSAHLASSLVLIFALLIYPVITTINPNPRKEGWALEQVKTAVKMAFFVSLLPLTLFLNQGAEIITTT